MFAGSLGCHRSMKREGAPPLQPPAAAKPKPATPGPPTLSILQRRYRYPARRAGQSLHASVALNYSGLFYFLGNWLVGCLLVLRGHDWGNSQWSHKELLSDEMMSE